MLRPALVVRFRHLMIKMFFYFISSTCSLMASQVTFAATTASFSVSNPPNVMPVSFLNFQPVVTVTVCLPGTQSCQTIPNVMLDSGSDGLRVFATGLPTGLPAVQNAGGDHKVALCSVLGGGKATWGPIVYADVILGGERALKVPIQAMDSTFPGLPDGCQNLATDRASMSGLNGILGVGTGLRPQAQRRPKGNGFFSCQGSHCTPCDGLLDWGKCVGNFPAPPSDFNPIHFLTVDNNGWILQLPTPAVDGSDSLTGTLILGLGTQKNNLPPPELQKFPIDAEGFFPVEFRGQIYKGVLDTGTAFWVFPQELTDVAHCKGHGRVAQFYCPPSPVDYQIVLLNRSTQKSAAISFQIINATLLKHSGAANNIGLSLGEESFAQGIFLLGAPFFMGRTIYYGLIGAQTPLGPGPFNAF